MGGRSRKKGIGRRGDVRKSTDFKCYGDGTVLSVAVPKRRLCLLDLRDDVDRVEGRDRQERRVVRYRNDLLQHKANGRRVSVPRQRGV
jgi:hypothetical protein